MSTKKQFIERRDELANRANDARIMLANNALVPFEGTIQSETDAVLLAQQGQQRYLNVDALTQEIEQETGRGLNMLAYYPAIDTIFDLLLPDGVRANVLYHSPHLLGKLSSSPVTTIGSGLKVTDFDRSDRTAFERSGDSEHKYDGLSSSSSSPLRASQTPDRLNKMVGNIKLDERVMVQLSIAAALVVGDILENVPSHEVQDRSSTLYQTKRVYYYEDLVKYIQSKYGDIITLDTKPGDAFENMNGTEVNTFTRTLLSTFAARVTDLHTSGSSVSAGITSDETTPQKVTLGDLPTLFYESETYKNRVDSMLKVTSQNVGKVWSSKKVELKEQKEQLHTAMAIYLGTRDVVQGYSNIDFGTKIKLPQNATSFSHLNTVNDLVHSILSLVALHVITYSLSYAIDAYIRLAIRGAIRNDSGEIEFKGIGAAEGDSNVITPQMIFPGIKAALEMYDVNPRTWDRKVAFHLHTNPAVMNLFLEAKKMYDLDTSRPGIKGFRNAKAEDPTWMKDRATQRELEEYYAKVKGRSNGSNDPAGGRSVPASTGGTVTVDAMRDTLGKKSTQNIVKSLEQLRQLSPEVDEINRIVGRDLITPRNNNLAPVSFGRKNRRRHSSSFGKKKRGSRRAASFGKKKRSKRHSSFGKKKRGSRRSNSFGKKKRGHRKH